MLEQANRRLGRHRKRRPCRRVRGARRWTSPSAALRSRTMRSRTSPASRSGCRSAARRWRTRPPGRSCARPPAQGRQRSRSSGRLTAPADADLEGDGAAAGDGRAERGERAGVIFGGHQRELSSICRLIFRLIIDTERHRPYCQLHETHPIPCMHNDSCVDHTRRRDSCSRFTGRGRREVCPSQHDRSPRDCRFRILRERSSGKRAPSGHYPRAR